MAHEFPCTAPMRYMPWRNFSKLVRLPRSDEADTLIVADADAELTCIFISHQWLTAPALLVHPDD